MGPRANTRLLAVAALLAGAVTLSAQPPAKPADPPKEPPTVRLPDGTSLWVGPAAAGTDAERVVLSPQDLKKLTDQVEQLRKQLAARKPGPPSGADVRGRVDRRGETLVAALSVTYTFRTAAPTTAVALGGRRAFLVAAALDGDPHPALDSTDDGLAVLVESSGDHTLTLQLEAPVAGRGAKNEVGFELGLPRAAITTLALDPPPGVRRVTLTTRTPDPTPPAKPPETRRVPGLDVQQLAPKASGGYPLGPVDQLEVSWDPPVAAAQPAEASQSADWDVTCAVNEGFVETTARLRLRGPAREWRVVAPAGPAADLAVDRATGVAPTADSVPAQPPVVTKPADAAKPVWRVELPAGSAAADWVVTAVARQPRPKLPEAKHRGPFPVGPFAVAGVSRQTGTVKVTAAAHTRLTFTKQGPDLRQADPPGPADDDVTTAFFRLATGPTGANPPFAPLLEVGAGPLDGAVRVQPVYKLRKTDAGWAVRAEVKVFPVRTTVTAVPVEVPAEWPTVQALPAGLVEGVQDPKTDAPRRVVVVRLAAAHKQPFDLVLEGTVAVPPGELRKAVPLLRFPSATGQDAQATATVPEGSEVRGTGWEWEGDKPVRWGQPLAAVPGADGRPPKAVTAVTGKFDRGLAQLDLSWHDYQPDLSADVKAEVTVGDQQVTVVQQVRLHSADGLPRAVRLRAPGAAHGLRAADRSPPLTTVRPGEWTFAPPADAKDVAVAFSYSVPLPRGGPDDRGPWAVPVGLVWPAGTTRTEAAVRVWGGGTAPLAVAVAVGPWRELPPDPAADRDALPVATLAGSGADLPLVLEVRDRSDPAVAVWVERATVQARVEDDGTVAYRARFLLDRWLTTAAEVQVPGATVGRGLSWDLDGGEPVSVPDAGTGPGGRTFRVPLPPARGRPVVLQVKYRLAAGATDALVPPRLTAAAYARGVRWQVTAPAGAVPLLFADDARAALRWRWRGGLYVPAAAESPEGLDRWLREGAESDDAGDADAVSARQASPAALRVYQPPRLLFVCGWSLLVVLVELTLTRLRAVVVLVATTLIGGAAAAAAVLIPQPTAQALAAAAPGQVLTVVVLLGLAAVRWYHRWRVVHLPGFSRRWTGVSPSEPAAPSARSRPSANGSAEVGQVAPSAR